MHTCILHTSLDTSTTILYLFAISTTCIKFTSTNKYYFFVFNMYFVRTKKQGHSQLDHPLMTLWCHSLSWVSVLLVWLVFPILCCSHFFERILILLPLISRVLLTLFLFAPNVLLSLWSPCFSSHCCSQRFTFLLFMCCQVDMHISFHSCMLDSQSNGSWCWI